MRSLRGMLRGLLIEDLLEEMEIAVGHAFGGVLESALVSASLSAAEELVIPAECFNQLCERFVVGVIQRGVAPNLAQAGDVAADNGAATQGGFEGSEAKGLVA